MKTNELTGAALDWAVAKCEGHVLNLLDVKSQKFMRLHKYSTDWAQGGPIIERGRLCVGFQHEVDATYVPSSLKQQMEVDPSAVCWARTTAGGYLKYGPTPLIAAMRCHVASKLGDEVEIPEELTK